MDVQARLVRGEKPKVIPIGRPFSNFRFIDETFPKLVSLRRIMSQVRQHLGRTMVVELVRKAGDLEEENKDIETRYGQKPNPTFTVVS